MTIIVPTIDADDSFADAARSWLANNPREIIIVTETSVAAALEKLAIEVDGPPLDPELRDAFPHTVPLNESTNRIPSSSNNDPIENPKKGRIRVITVPKANKRLQMAAGIQETRTDLIVFADDDALWPKTLLASVLACFEDQSIGGVGTSQVVKPCNPSGKLTVWETLAAFRLTIRNIEISASTHIDGGIPCLSGRTAAYRTMILKDPKFSDGFTHDFWRGKYHLNSGDDKFLTRWMVSHGWKTYAQCCKEAELQSTMKPDWRFLKQVLRWTRNTWRSDMRSMFMERHIWTTHPYVAFTMVDKIINPFTLLAGPCLVLYLMIRSSAGNAPNGFHLPAWNIIFSYIAWLLITRTLKLLPHLYKRPQDIIYIPVWLLFGYYFAVMKLYALMTLHVTGWGTREGIDDPTAATTAAEMQQKDKENTNQSYEEQPNLSEIGIEERIRYNHYLEEDQRVYHHDETHDGHRVGSHDDGRVGSHDGHRVLSHEGFNAEEDEIVDKYYETYPSNQGGQEGLAVERIQETHHSQQQQHPTLKLISTYKAPLHNPFSPPQSNHQSTIPTSEVGIESEFNPSHHQVQTTNSNHLHHETSFLGTGSGLPIGTTDPVVEISITSPDLRRRRYYY